MLCPAPVLCVLVEGSAVRVERGRCLLKSRSDGGARRRCGKGGRSGAREDGGGDGTRIDGGSNAFNKSTRECCPSRTGLRCRRPSRTRLRFRRSNRTRLRWKRRYRTTVDVVRGRGARRV